MSYQTALATVASAVAQNGNFTVSYPDGTSAGTFAAYGHRMFARGLQRMFTQDAGEMSVSFGASNITVTYKGATSIPADTVVNVEFNIAGDVDPQKDLVGSDLVESKRVSFAPLMKIDLGSPDAADPNGIVESQDLTSAGVYSTLAFNGVYGDPYNNTKAVLDVPRNVVAAWSTAAVLTVTGKDEYGNVMIESSSSGTSFTGKKAFKEITDVSVSANVTGLTVGTGDVLGLPVYMDKIARIVAEYQDGVALAAFRPNKILIPFFINATDLAAGTAANLVAPCAGYITGIKTIVQAAIGTGGAITVELNTSTVTGLSVTLGDSDAAGTVDEDSIGKIAAGLAAAGDDITVTPAAAFASSGAVNGFLIFEPVAEVNGTFVAGVQTAATATTGDVRGTYDPAEACDGSIAFSLLVDLPDPTYKGADQYDG